MTIGNATGTVLVPARWQAGMQYTSVGTYAFGAAVAQNDTITWDDLIPKGAQVLSVIGFLPELDTNASPTGTVDVGTVADADIFIDGASVGLAAAGSNQVVIGPNIITGTGAIGDKTTYSTATDLVMSFTAAFATAASTGNVVVYVHYYCVDSF